jgi:hypothetical protein
MPLLSANFNLLLCFFAEERDEDWLEMEGLAVLLRFEGRQKREGVFFIRKKKD